MEAFVRIRSAIGFGVEGWQEVKTHKIPKNKQQNPNKFQKSNRKKSNREGDFGVLIRN
jgi:hypothetical protein